MMVRKNGNEDEGDADGLVMMASVRKETVIKIKTEGMLKAW